MPTKSVFFTISFKYQETDEHVSVYKKRSTGGVILNFKIQ